MKLTKTIKFLWMTLAGFLYIFPFKALAQNPPTIGGIRLPESNFENTRDLVIGIVNRFLWFAVFIAVIAVIYSGIMYITAGGDTTKAETARKNLTWSITGIILVIVSLVIVSFVITVLSNDI